MNQLFIQFDTTQTSATVAATLFYIRGLFNQRIILAYEIQTADSYEVDFHNAELGFENIGRDQFRVYNVGPEGGTGTVCQTYRGVPDTATLQQLLQECADAPIRESGDGFAFGLGTGDCYITLPIVGEIDYCKLLYGVAGAYVGLRANRSKNNLTTIAQVLGSSILFNEFSKRSWRRNA